MKIIFLSPHKHLIEFLQSNGDEVIQCIDELTEEMLEGTDFIISYGYHKKVSEEVINRFKNKIINLHISYLPYNRGADPNLWSFLEDTPKGVTIHYMDKSIDTGAILAREEVEYDLENDTLRSTYKRLSERVEDLFYSLWDDIRLGKIEAVPQLTYHRVSNKDRYMHLLTNGWDTPIKNIIGKAKEQ